MSPQNTLPTTSGTSELLRSLTQSAEEKLVSLETGAPAVSLDEKIAAVQAQLEKATNIQESAARDDAKRILTSTLEELRSRDEKDKGDFAEIVLSLDVLMKDVGHGLENLLKPSDDEAALITAAETRIKNADAALVTANGKMAFLGNRERAVTAANAEIVAAKLALDETKKRVARMARTRLQTADIEQSMQNYMSMSDRSQQVMMKRHEKIGAQLQIVRARLTAAQAIKKQSAAALETLEQQLAAAEQDLIAEESQLSELTNGTPAYSDQEKKISDLRSKAEEIRGNRNVAQTIYQSKEEFVAQLEVHITATRRTHENQKIWMGKQESDNEERQVTWMNKLEMMKAMADMEVAVARDDAGSKIDLDTTSYMATASGLADKQRMQMTENHPRQMRAIADITAAQAKNIVMIRQRENAVLDEFKKKWGIDPLAASFMGDERDAAAQPTAA